VKDSGVTGSPWSGLFRDAGCSSAFVFNVPITVMPVGSPSISWNLTPPTVSFVQPFHREYR